MANSPGGGRSARGEAPAGGRARHEAGFAEKAAPRRRIDAPGRGGTAGGPAEGAAPRGKDRRREPSEPALERPREGARGRFGRSFGRTPRSHADSHADADCPEAGRPARRVRDDTPGRAGRAAAGGQRGGFPELMRGAKPRPEPASRPPHRHAGDGGAGLDARFPNRPARRSARTGDGAAASAKPPRHGGREHDLPGAAALRDEADAPASPIPRRATPLDAAAPADAATGGAVWLHGVHPVAAALANPARRLRRLLLTEAGRAALIPKLPPPWRIGPEPAEKENLARLLGAETVHQGCALLAEPLEAPPLERFLEHSSGPLLVLDQVTDPRNVGAILRSAAAFGAAGVVVQERHAPGETGVLARAASGALEAVPVLREVNLARAIGALKQAGLWVVGLEAGAPVTLAQAARGLQGRRVALILGAEGEGLRRLTHESCDEMARLPIRRAMESLNVAAAAAVALYELSRE